VHGIPARDFGLAIADITARKPGGKRTAKDALAQSWVNAMLQPTVTVQVLQLARRRWSGVRPLADSRRRLIALTHSSRRPTQSRAQELISSNWF